MGNIGLCAETVKQLFDDYESAMIRAMRAKECVDKYSYDFIAKQQLVFFNKIVDTYGTDFHE